MPLPPLSGDQAQESVLSEAKPVKIPRSPYNRAHIMNNASRPPLTPRRENLLVNLLFNIVAPTLILTKFSSHAYLGPTYGVVVALLFPLGYGTRDFIIRRKINFFSALGVLSVCLTGGISLLGLDPRYLAIKEAAVPGLLGLVTLGSLKTRYPLVKTLLYNDAILHTEKIDHALTATDSHRAFERRLTGASWIIAGSFFLSSALNFLLATYLVTSQPGSTEYNEQLGHMTALSFPVIALPAMLVMVCAMIYLFKGITGLTGMTLEQLIRHSQQDPE